MGQGKVDKGMYKLIKFIRIVIKRVCSYVCL